MFEAAPRSVHDPEGAAGDGEGEEPGRTMRTAGTRRLGCSRRDETTTVDRAAVSGSCASSYSRFGGRAARPPYEKKNCAAVCWSPDDQVG